MRRGAAAAAAALLTGCGTTLGGTDPPAGHQSPASAMAGFIGNMLANRPVAACKYAQPSQGPCATALAAEGKMSGSWRIGHTAISGNRAIVDVEYANACGFGVCINNGNPDAGLPGPGLSFDTAYEQARNAKNYAMACVRIGGAWYVDFGSSG
jgi:hypothetical protein